MARQLGDWVLAIDGSSLPDRELIGGKAWSIAHMQSLGLNVPPAVVISTKACAHYLEHGEQPDGLIAEIKAGIEYLEQETALRFGEGAAPLLVSVRSGAAISMPGMMDTVLNLGITPATEIALAERSSSAVFAKDTHRRFVELYADIVMKATVPALDAAADVASWYDAVADAAGRPLPESAFEQLLEAVVAIFESSNSRRAKRYRKHNNLPDTLGTAVTIQAMVFGNLDEQSGTGVLFSRNPLTGDPTPYGEYLHRAQGEDVVSGKFTPEPLDALKQSAPHLYDELIKAAQTLERTGADVQDIEFTVQQGVLYLLQARTAKRAPLAAVRFAVDLVAEGLVDEATALSRVSAEQVRSLLLPGLQDSVAGDAEVLCAGEPACQGVGVGVVVSNPDEAEKRAAAGEPVVLARVNTSPEDVHGMIASKAVITERGGATSHAAVVSRALGVPCVVGCGDGAFADRGNQTVTVDGTSGKIFAGALAVERPSENDDPLLATLIEWARKRCSIRVCSTSTPPADALDLSKIEGGEDPARLTDLIGDAKSVMGGALESDAGVTAALDCGVETIATEHVLPTLLVALEYAQR